MRFTDRVVLVTGGTGVLGTSLVKSFLLEGAKVAVPYRPGREWAAYAAALDSPEDLAGFPCDLTRESEAARLVEAVAKRFGRVDVLVNGVGGWKPGRLADTGLDALREMLDLNLASAYSATRATLPGMLERKEGRIVFVGAADALEPQAGSLAHGVSKAALLHFALAVAREVAGSGVTANAVVPSTILTDANTALGKPEEMARWVAPHELAAAILFLASPEASGVNGALVRVPGRL